MSVDPAMHLLAPWARAAERHWCRIPGEPDRYEQSGQGHHHHFQCEACGRVFDIPCRIGDTATEVPRDFEVSRHEVMVYGRCGQCA